jgi:DNA-binding response OmpR family regulator
MSKKILILEDNKDLAETISDILELEDYEVEIANDGYKAAELTYKNKYDLYILDINVPQMNGLELLKGLRNISDKTPTIIISALIDIKTIKESLNIGINNYLKKPFQVEELLLYVELILNEKDNDTNLIKYKDLEYNKQTKLLRKKNKIINLGKVQLKIFDILINNIGILIQKEELLECLDKYSEFALRTAINKLKNNIEIDIINVRGIGYLIDKS